MLKDGMKEAKLMDFGMVLGLSTITKVEGTAGNGFRIRCMAKELSTTLMGE